MTEAISLQTTCASCDRPVALRYVPQEQPGETIYCWVCPYPDCRNDDMNIIGLKGSAPKATIRPTA